LAGAAQTLLAWLLFATGCDRTVALFNRNVIFNRNSIIYFTDHQNTRLVEALFATSEFSKYQCLDKLYLNFK
jgi:hypothetical protein